MEKISWIDHVKNGKVLQRVKEETNIPQTLKWRKDNWIGHTLRRNCLLKYVIVGKIKERIKVTGIRERRRKHLPDGLKGKTGYRKLKDEALDLTLSRPCFGRGCRPVGKTDSRMNEWIYCIKSITSAFGLHLTILNLIQLRTPVNMLETHGCIRYQLRKELVLHRVDELWCI
jgi:hypothetical protein